MFTAIPGLYVYYQPPGTFNSEEKQLLFVPLPLDVPPLSRTQCPHGHDVLPDSDLYSPSHTSILLTPRLVYNHT